MKANLCLLALGLFLEGCCCSGPYVANPCNPYGPYAPCNPRQRIVVNNTGYVLEVMQDNRRVAVLRNGEQCGLYDYWLTPKSTVTVTGHTESGVYIGADCWIFNSGSAEIWQVNQLQRPLESR